MGRLHPKKHDFWNFLVKNIHMNKNYHMRPCCLEKSLKSNKSAGTFILYLTILRYIILNFLIGTVIWVDSVIVFLKKVQIDMLLQVKSE